jgi:hypothetical protein
LANVRAYRIIDGDITPVNVMSTGGYQAAVGIYNLEFTTVETPVTDISIIATVTEGQKPVMDITPKVIKLEQGTQVDPKTGVVVTDEEDGQIMSTFQPNLDTSKPGVQVITYSATDNDQNIVVGKRTYIIASPEQQVVVGPEYVIFASDFTKREREVNTSEEAIVEDAQAQAFKLDDGTNATVGVYQTNGYTDTVGKYQITLGITQEPGTTTVAIANVVDNETAEIKTKNIEVTYEAKSNKTEAEFLADVSVQLIYAENLTTNFEKVVNFNKVGTYKVTLSATIDFTNNISTLSLLNKQADTIGTEITVHIVDTTVKVPPTGSLAPTGENIMGLLLLGSLIMLFSIAILALIMLLRRKKDQQETSL